MATRQRTTEKSDYAGGDARIEEYLDKKGVSWTFIDSIDPGAFDAEKSAKNNARFIALDERRVEEYAEAMKRGDNFPPVIAYKGSGGGKYLNADGNHRLHAAIKADMPLKAYDITGAKPETLVIISFEANTRHGLPTSEEERVQQAIYLINMGATIKAAAATVNVPERIVKKASEKATTDRRFIENGIAPTVIEQLGASVKWRLAQITTDEGFVAAVNLAARTKLDSTVWFQLVTEINDLRSSEKQVLKVQELEERYLSDVQESAGGILNGKRALGPRARVSMMLGQLMNLPDDYSIIAEQYVGPERDEVAKKMREASRRLNDMAKALAS
jgi:hypothetical protein